MPEPPRAPRPVNVSHDRRHVALVPSLLGCRAAFACALSSLLEGAGADLPQLAERMHAAVGLVVLGAIFTAVADVTLVLAVVAALCCDWLAQGVYVDEGALNPGHFTLPPGAPSTWERLPAGLDGTAWVMGRQPLPG